MKTTRNCRVCGSAFEIDHRNVRHHAFCARAECQKVRRALSQAGRRASKATHASLGPFSRLQISVKPTEADKLAEHPLFIGLISMLTGSSDREEIETICRRLHDRGRNILSLRSEISGIRTPREF